MRGVWIPGRVILIMSRRKEFARQTVEIIEAGHYYAGGQRVEIGAALKAAVEGTRLYEPDGFSEVIGPEAFETVIEVTNESTIEAAARLTGHNTVALNFASAKNPGGGFLRGAHAQEEALARASGLYATLLEGRAYYEFHRAQGDLLYSDHMIYSPRVPVFRDDDGNLLAAPYEMSFITSAAPNRGAIRDAEQAAKVLGALEQRARKVLALAHERAHTTLILGAWGCGVFRNDPIEVAETFRDLLTGPYKNRFEQVTFAVWDPQKTTKQFEAFVRTFG